MAIQNKPQIEEVIEKSGDAKFDKYIKELENAIEESIEAFNASIRELLIGIKEIKNINLNDTKSKKAKNHMQPEDHIQRISDLTICLPNKVHIVNNFKSIEVGYMVPNALTNEKFYVVDNFRSTEVERTLSDYVSILQKISGLKKIVEETILSALDDILVNSNDYSKYRDADKKFINDMFKMHIVFEVISKQLVKIAACKEMSADGEKINRETKREYERLSLLASIIDDNKKYFKKHQTEFESRKQSELRTQKYLDEYERSNGPIFPFKFKEDRKFYGISKVYDDLRSLIVEFEKYAETHQDI